MTQVVHKYHANGNDFILTENADCITTLKARKTLADRKLGIGCDQILFLQHNPSITRCTFYNQDGHSASLCLNGLYVVSQHLRNNYGEQNYSIEAEKDTYLTDLKEQSHALHIPKATRKHFSEFKIPFDEWKTYPAYHIDVGNPHLIILVPENELNAFPLKQLGKALQTCPPFIDGVNVSCLANDFTTPQTSMRIFERGVGLTESCGSAALSATYLIEHHTNKDNICIQQPGGKIQLHKPDKSHPDSAWLFQSRCCYVAKISLAPQPE